MFHVSINVFFLLVAFCDYAVWNGLVGKLRLVQSGRHAHWSKYEERCAFARAVTDMSSRWNTFRD